MIYAVMHIIIYVFSDSYCHLVSAEITFSLGAVIEI